MDQPRLFEQGTIDHVADRACLRDGAVECFGLEQVNCDPSAAGKVVSFATGQPDDIAIFARNEVVPGSAPDDAERANDQNGCRFALKYEMMNSIESMAMLCR